MARDIKIGGTPLLKLPLKSKGLGKNCDSKDKSEYVCKVKWIKTRKLNEAYKIPKNSIWIPRAVRAKADNLKNMIRFVERKFDINIKNIINNEKSA